MEIIWFYMKRLYLQEILSREWSQFVQQLAREREREQQRLAGGRPHAHRGRRTGAEDRGGGRAHLQAATLEQQSAATFNQIRPVIGGQQKNPGSRVRG